MKHRVSYNFSVYRFPTLNYNYQNDEDYPERIHFD